jgi:undecaprenyl diphosphate synthase
VTSDTSAGPKHIAIIMDGNGRWANQHGLPRTAGHKQGIEALRRALHAARDCGVKYLTIYSFSTENWTRPPTEVSFLLDLMRRFIRQDVAELHAAGVRIRIIGDRDNLDKALVKLINDAEQLTRNNTDFNLLVAFNYGGRQELVRAARAIAEKVKSGVLVPKAVDADAVSAELDTADVPDPEMLIRTGGEMRISNFLLWQSAYTEFVFIPEYWPEFNADILKRTIAEYHGRERRFGGLKPVSAASTA